MEQWKRVLIQRRQVAKSCELMKILLEHAPQLGQEAWMLCVLSCSHHCCSQHVCIGPQREQQLQPWTQAVRTQE
eukprot:3733850-Rhodomonas_salina.1